MFHEAKGDSVQIARMYMDSLLVESRVVGAVKPAPSGWNTNQIETQYPLALTAAISSGDVL